jgi:hypothetical protein
MKARKISNVNININMNDFNKRNNNKIKNNSNRNFHQQKTVIIMNLYQSLNKKIL